jgi:hypothetical protein
MTTNIVIRRIIYPNVKFVHHICPNCLDEVWVQSDHVVFESIPSDIINGERILHISNMDDDPSTVPQKGFKTMVRHSSNCEYD